MKNKANSVDYDGLNRIIHERARLAILSTLIAHQGTTAFNFLKHACHLTDGNLNRHLQVLQEAEMITISKSFEDSKPLTKVKLIGSGRAQFLDYITILEQVVNDAKHAETINVLSQPVTLK